MRWKVPSPPLTSVIVSTDSTITSSSIRTYNTRPFLLSSFFLQQQQQQQQPPPHLHQNVTTTTINKSSPDPKHLKNPFHYRYYHHHYRPSTPQTRISSKPGPGPNSPTIASLLKRLFGSHAQISSEAMSAARVKAQSIIDDNSVVVFSKSYCPYCRASKALLSENGAKYYLMELDQVEDGAAIQDALQEMTNQRSVPNIFIKQEHIGGNSDLQARKSQLPALLERAGAV